MKNKRAIIITIIAAAIVGYAAYFFHVGDYIEAAIYKPTEEMSAVMTSIKLTSKGNRVFRSANPSLESNEDFNENCKTVSKDAYVLGCYITVSDQIHLYNVQFTEETKNLRGIIESTAAHEMLHAAWSRMNSWDRTSISNKLQAVYDSADKDFKKEFDTYSKNEFYDELHARVGVELKNIPEELEKHYAEYFEDRQAIVNYYEKYRSVFKELRKKADEQGKEKTLVENMRFQSGHALRTEEASLVGINLDDTKLATLDALSRSQFIKKLKRIQLKLSHRQRRSC